MLHLMTILFRKINFEFVQFLKEPSPLLLNSFPPFEIL